MCGDFNGDLSNDFVLPDGVDSTKDEFCQYFCEGKDCGRTRIITPDPCSTQTLVQCTSTIMRSFSSKELMKDTLYLGREGEIWGVFRELMSDRSFILAVLSIMC